MKDISSGLSSLKSAIGTSKKSGGAVGNYDVKGNTWKPGETNKKMDPRAHQGTSADSRNKTRTKWNNKSIILYMPPQLTVNYNAAWKEQELGGNVRDIVKLGQQAVDNFTGPGGKVSMDSMADGLTAKAGGQLVKGGLNVLANTLDRTWKSAMAGAGMDIGGAIDKTENQAINNFLETMFTGISHRKFSYTWKFAPKNAEEMKTVQEIIHTFKYHMLPDRPKDGQWGRYWVVPDEFDIFYMFRGEENQWLNKINTCVLINMDINYTPQQYQTFRPMVGKKGAPPTEIDMKLDFMETKLVTKTEVMDGF